MNKGYAYDNRTLKQPPFGGIEEDIIGILTFFNKLGIIYNKEIFMKKIFVLIFFVSFIINSYAQDIPNWVRGGMSINEVKNELKITQNENMNNMEIGSGKLGEGIWEEREKNLYIYLEIISFSPFQSGIIYQFLFDSENKLNAFWIIGKFEKQQLIDSFTNKYGSFTIDEDGDYEWIKNLSQNIVAISVKIEQNNHANILFFFSGYN